jgi:hypothetical protein
MGGGRGSDECEGAVAPPFKIVGPPRGADLPMDAALSITALLAIQPLCPASIM